MKKKLSRKGIFYPFVKKQTGRIMRLTFLFLLLGLMQVSASSYSQNTKLNLDFQGVKVKEVMQAIENQSKYRFAYSSEFIDLDRKINISIHDQGIDEILQTLFAGTNIRYELDNRMIMLYAKGEMAAFQQQRTVTGKVTDSSRAPLPGVTIVVKGTTMGTITDADGNYSLTKVPDNATLVFSFVGMKPLEVLVADQNVINAVLQEETIGLDEVVAIGYGVQKKKLTTGSTIEVNGEDLQKLSTVSALGALQSQTPGVSITQNSGMPGEGYKVTIRGLGTVGSSSPLYVIDGVAGGDINTLSPSDIESVDVLKDAASAAIYGARAANGVILVTTKQGKAGKIQTSYDGYIGIQNPLKKIHPLNAKQYMSIMNEVNSNEGLTPYDWENMIPDLYARIENGSWNGTNWLKEIRNKNAVTQSHDLNITSGTQDSKYSFGFSYSGQEGIYGAPVEPKFDRYTTRINSEHILLRGREGMEVIKFGENFVYNYNKKSGIGIGDIYSNDIHNAIATTPLMPVYNDEGEYFAKDDIDASGLNGLGALALSNPVADMIYERGMNSTKNHVLHANAYLQIQPISKLIFKSSFGYKTSGSSYREYIPTYELSQAVMNTVDKVTQNMDLGNRWSWENTLNYRFRFGKHDFDALVGQSLEKWGLGEYLGATNGYSIFDDYKHAWLSNTQGLTSGVTQLEGYQGDRNSIGKSSLASFFGRINYNYNETYMASVIMRGDGSSNFGRGNRWGYFPSVSAGWVITNESFLKRTQGWLDFLKIRGSWGKNGNCDIDNFQYLSTFAFSSDYANYSFGNSKDTQSTGGYADILANPDITWEKSEQLDFGFDGRLFDSRLGVTFDWYKKTTKDWLVKAPILDSYGTGAPYINGGDVENKGFELAFSWNQRSGDLTYGFNLNLAHNKNEVKRIDNKEGIIHGASNVLSQGTGEMYRAEVGKPIGYFWGYKTAGVFQNQAEIDAWQAAGKGILESNPQPGDLIFVDTNKDGSVTEADKTEIGNPHPDYTLGFSMNFGYKGFDFSTTLSGAFGQQIAKSYRSFGDHKEQNYTSDILGRWHGEGTSNHLPRLTSGSYPNYFEISDIYIEDGDYLKVQNVTLGYDFKKLFPRMPLTQARFYLSVQNLCTFTGYSGMDPEVGYGFGEDWVSGIDLGFYPSPRTFLVGCNIKL